MVDMNMFLTRRKCFNTILNYASDHHSDYFAYLCRIYSQ